MVRKWCQEFHEGRRKVHNELCTSRRKVVMNKIVNTIHALLNEDRSSKELETIMNDNNDEVKTFTQNYFANLGTQFCSSTIEHTKISLEVR